MSTSNAFVDMQSTEHADLLATKWWSGEEFTAQGMLTDHRSAAAFY